MQATVYNLAGDQVDTVELSDAIFGITPNMKVIRQAVLRQQANARQGTSDTKTRADVSGGGKKPWRQKGTGRARQGSTRSPQWTHGGVVFGPHPRSYVQDMPRKMRRLAIRGVLSAKLADGQLLLIDSFEDLEPRTKEMIALLEKLNVGKGSALFMTSELEPSLELAAANVRRVKTMSAHLLSIVDMLKYDYLVMPRSSLEVVQTILSDTGGRRKLPLKSTPPSSGEEATAEVKPAKAPAKPRAKSATKARTKAATKTAAKSEAKTSSKTESKGAPKAKAKTKAAPKTKANAPAKATPKAAAKTSADAAPAEKPAAETKSKVSRRATTTSKATSTPRASAAKAKPAAKPKTREATTKDKGAKS